MFYRRAVPIDAIVSSLGPYATWAHMLQTIRCQSFPLQIHCCSNRHTFVTVLRERPQLRRGLYNEEHMPVHGDHDAYIYQLDNIG